MADISKITLLNGTTYNLKDQQARDDIAAIQGAIAGGVTFMGETSTALTDGSTTKSIVINSATVTAVKGYLVVYNSKEFVFDGDKWIEMGDLSLIGDLGWKDSASGNYTPTGTVSQPTFSGNELTSTGNFTPAGNVTISKGTGTANYTPQGTVSQPTFSGNELTSTGKFTPGGSVGLTTSNKTATVSKAASGDATYTPEGTVGAPTISVKTAGATTTVNSITAVGTLPSLTTTVANEVLTIGFDQGTLPTKGANQTVKTGDAAYQASAPAFTGTGARLVTGNIAVPTSASFTGTEGNVSVSGTPTGTVSQPSFTGTGAELKGTFSGTQGSVSVKGTPSGTVTKPTFTGTQGTVTVT